MTEEMKKKWISELPETKHGRIGFYKYATDQIKTNERQNERLGVLVAHLKQELGDEVKNV